MANPAFAPYGRAALSILKNAKLESRLKGNLILGVNVAQTYQFVATGNALFGFVALSQLIGQVPAEQYWRIPANLYPKIKQDLIIIRGGKNQKEAMAFSSFIMSPAGQDIIRGRGYSVN